MPDLSLCPTSFTFSFPTSCFYALLRLTFLHSRPSIAPSSTWGTWSHLLAQLWDSPGQLSIIKSCLKNTNFLQTNGGDGSDRQGRAICLGVHFIQQASFDSLIYCRHYTRDWSCKGDQGPFLVLKVPRSEIRVSSTCDACYHLLLLCPWQTLAINHTTLPSPLHTELRLHIIVHFKLLLQATTITELDPTCETQWDVLARPKVRPGIEDGMKRGGMIDYLR